MPNEPERYVVSEQDAGARLDAWLAGVTDLTRSALQQLLEKGAVRRNGKPVAKSLRVAAGDVVELQHLSRLKQMLETMNILQL